MEQEICSWLEKTYESGQETDFVRKETLWNDFVKVSEVDSQCREAFFACLGRCIAQSSMKGITVTRSKGKNIGYRCLRRKQGQRGLQQDSEYERVPSTSCEKKEEEIERGIYESHLSVQNQSAPTNSSPHSESKQSVSHIPKIVKKNAPSYHHDGYIKLREESTMEKRSDDGVTDVEVQESINVEQGRSSPEKDLEACQVNEAEEEWNLVDDNYLHNEDEEEWTDNHSEIAVETKRSPKWNKKRKQSSSSSSSSMAGFSLSKYRQKGTRKKGKRRNILVSSDEEGQSAETFFKNHHKKLKSLLPRHLPSRPQSFHEYLRRVLDIPNTEIPRRITIHHHSGNTGNHKSALRRSFMAASFPPVKVGQVAGSEIQHTFPGDVFPQFTHHGKSNYHCELCSPFLRWAKKNGVKHSAYKSSKVTIDDIINDTAIISFSGVIQVREHFNSKVHQEALSFFKRDFTEVVKEADADQFKRKKVAITNYFAPKNPLN